MKNIFFKLTAKEEQQGLLLSQVQITVIKFLGTLIVITLLVCLAFLSLNLPTSAAYPHFPYHAPTPLEQGQIFYEAGQFKNAIQVWKDAAVHFEKKRNKKNQALILSYLALSYQQSGQILQSDIIIHTALEMIRKYDDNFIYAQILNNQGHLLFNQGKTEAALETWRLAEKKYHNSGDKVGEFGTQINQAKALQMLGYFLRANALFQQVEAALSQQPDSQLKISILLNLGNSWRIIGDYKNARDNLEKSLDIAQKLGLSTEQQIALLNLGKVANSENNIETALKLFQQVANSQNPISEHIQLQARLYQLDILWQLHRLEEVEQLILQIHKQIDNLPPTQTTIYAQIELAASLVKFSSSSKITLPNLLIQSAELLANARQQAQTLGNSRAESTAFGKLGNLYEQTQQWEIATSLTTQALKLAQKINAPDIAYQWEWQMGRILNAQGDKIGAIANYKQAFQALQSLRQDLVAINQDIQFSFRESVEPVYRELVDLLLQDIPNTPASQQQNNLIAARETIEALQLAELANFFREACLDSKTVPIETIDSTAALIYPIILSDRIEVILSLPNQPLRHYSTKIPQSEVEAAIKDMRQSLRRTSFAAERLTIAQKIYTWLLADIAPDLIAHQIRTLVFILDRELRNIPISALHDGEKYLIEKYQIALAPSLQLFKSQPRKNNQIQVLAGGMSYANAEFAALPGVEQEIQQISTTIPTTVLLNEKFTNTKLKAKLQNLSYSVMHLASHGQFSSKASDTFIKTWDGQINIHTLSKLMSDRNLKGSSPIDLLVLSACQTAKGDERATLGLAGVAVRSGARSTLASLWTVNDASTAKLMSTFYRELLKPKVKKVEALRLAQLELLQTPEFKHPYYWAAFILVGNWL
ncbi:hypothetical protein NIES4101_87150 [Calothrix sp. NIES-4101]|nr:hypothetical protein NIES4101_87150 [Calothrix sp. NIES-4101]